MGTSAHCRDASHVCAWKRPGYARSSGHLPTCSWGPVRIGDRRQARDASVMAERTTTPEEITMRCYECAKLGTAEPAVAVCRSCSAGLCLTHLRETANFMATGAIRPS